MRRRLLGLALAALLVTPTTSAFASAAGDGDPPAHVAVLGQRYRSELTRQTILTRMVAAARVGGPRRRVGLCDGQHGFPRLFPLRAVDARPA